MARDPHDKMRTPGAAARRDMDGRANQPPTKKKGCLRGAAVLVLFVAGGIAGVAEFAQAVRP